jgi:acetolactate synthase-1/2/3 large subunit
MAVISLLLECRGRDLPTLRKAFNTPGPVLIGVKVDYRDSVKLFEDVHEGITV